MVPLEVRLVTPILIVLLSGPDSAQSRGLSCLEPEPPFLGKINKQREPDLYKFARAEFQTYLEKLEQHLRCLEHERAEKLRHFSQMYNRYKQNYGDDAVFRYNQNENKHE